jgi:hypothetical protein
MSSSYQRRLPDYEGYRERLQNFPFVSPKTAR